MLPFVRAPRLDSTEHTSTARTRLDSTPRSHASIARLDTQHASAARLGSAPRTQHGRVSYALVSVCCPSGLVRCLRLLRSAQACQASTQKVETGRRQTALMAGLECLATRTQNLARHLPGQPGRIGLPSRYHRGLKLVLSPSTTAMTSQALGIGLGPSKSAWGLRQERAPCRGVGPPSTIRLQPQRSRT